MLHTLIEILAFLGLFLFGMFYLEERIRSASGRSFKRMINNATRTNIRSLFLGFSATAIFQSSSVVSLMTLSLIGAGTLSLENSIGILFGSNIGSTVTSWIIAIIGFKFDIKLVAYSMIAFGGIGTIFVDSQSRLRQYLGAMVGFGLIFLGLEGMKESFTFISKDFDIATYHDLNPLIFLFIGLVLTGIIQSSAAAIALAQSALFTQLINFEMAAFFVIGANIGTTVTVLLGAIGGSSDKKRAAILHLFFNISTALVALLLFAPLEKLTFFIISPTEQVIALALFHTLFNILGVLLWFFWIPKLALLLHKMFKKKPLLVTKYIHEVSPEVPIVALESLDREVRYLTQKMSEFALFAINIVPHQALDKHLAIDKLLERSKEPLDISYAKLYTQLQYLEGEIFNYASALSLRISEKEQAQLTRLTNIATYMASAAKAIKDMLSDLELLSDASQSVIERFYHNIRYQVLNSVLIFRRFLDGDEQSLESMHQSYKKIDTSYKGTLESINDIAQHTNIDKNLTVVAVNDVHLTRRFTKNLYRALQAYAEAKQ